MWTEQLSQDQKRGLLLLRAYEKACKKACGGGYRTDPITDESCLSRPSFKQAVTVAKWLEKEGFKVGVREVNWSGYMEYVFDHFSRIKMVPAVGQLKNSVLLQKFFQHHSVSFAAPVGRSDSRLEQLYGRILLPEIGQNCRMLHLLGLSKSDRVE